MLLNLSIGTYVQHLRRAGFRGQSVNNILQHSNAAVGPLIELATSTYLSNEDPPIGYAPIHALRLLGELHSLRMIEPLLASVAYPFKNLTQTHMFRRHSIPQIIERIGAACRDMLWHYADDSSHHETRRSGAFLSLAYVTTIDKETCEPIIIGLYERSLQSDNCHVNVGIVRALGCRGAACAYNDALSRRCGRSRTYVGCHSTPDAPVARGIQTRQSHEDSSMGMLRHTRAIPRG